MNIEAFELMLEKLKRIRDREDQRKRFDLTKWNNGIDLYAHEGDADEHCGFAGCVMGWAGHEHWFEKMGLRVDLERMGDKGHIRVFYRDHPDQDWKWSDRHDYALAAFFEVPVPTIANIIYPENYGVDYPTVEHVIARIELLLREGPEAFNEHCDAECDAAVEEYDFEAQSHARD